MSPSLRNIKDILESQSLAPQKSLGQNFLTNKHISEKIVIASGITRQDTAIELGVGLGSLTFPLAEHAGKVIGLEIDKGIIQWHNKQKDLPDNVSLLPQDLLQADFHQLSEATGAKLKIVANLPYSISTPLLFRLLDQKDSIDWAVVMLQKEVADRLMAKPHTKEYGVLTVLFSPFTKIESVLSVGPGNFHPRPKVDSKVIRLTFLPPESRQIPKQYKESCFFPIVKHTFQQRRKTLLNSLSSIPQLTISKNDLKHLLPSIKINPTDRPENLSAKEFINLSVLLLPYFNTQ